MSIVNDLKERVLSGENINRKESLTLFNENFEELCKSANEIRKHFCGNNFDICTIINAKSGKCSENCKYCAQSAHHKTTCDIYPLLSTEQITKEAKKQHDAGVLRFSLVTSGRNLSDAEIDEVCKTAVELNDKVPIKICGSFGLLNGNQYKKLYNAGIKRMHNNLETSKENFKNMCTTHTFEDKIASIKSAQENGMTVCSGGIFGIGETIEDRISLAFSLKDLGIKSIPLNLLNPVPGTPFQNNKPLSNEEYCRIIAVFRFILPDAFIRLAGGRGLLADKGRQCLLSGANAMISGDMLTTSGISVPTDLQMLKELGYEVKLVKE